MRTIFLLAMLAAVAAGNSAASTTYHVDHGNIQTYAAEMAAQPGFMTKILGAKINVKGVTGKDESAANILRQSVKDAGFAVTDEAKAVSYTVEETFAGDASDYVAQPGPERTGFSVPIFRILTTAAFCAIGICNNLGVATELINQDVNAANANVHINAFPSDGGQSRKPYRMVVTKLCGGNTCASTLSVSFDPDISLAQLRDANAKYGLAKSLGLN